MANKGEGYNTQRAVTARSSTTAASLVEAGARKKKMHPKADPHGRTIECLFSPSHQSASPVAIGLDVTSSRGGDTGIIYAGLPRFWGHVLSKELVPDPQLLTVGIGDFTHDRAPIQVGNFEVEDHLIDEDLKRLWIEGGGGGTGRESYELAAFLLARRTKIDYVKGGKKRGVAFFLGDEGFYDRVTKDAVKYVFGQNIPEDIPSEEIFAELQRSFDTFLIFPGASLEKRRAGIDKEIRRRVQSAGGMVDGVDMRFSLAWENRNDLDLHVRTPSGQHHIYYGAKQAPCGGYLDVDMNVGGETTKPVENVRWAKGSARVGKYEVWVQNFRYHEGNRKAIPFKVEIEINGEISHFAGTIQAGAEKEGSEVKVGTFSYDPAGRDGSSAYDAYDPKVIKAQWATVLPQEHILSVEDPKCVNGLMLGVLGLRSGKMSLDQLEETLKADGAPREHIKQVRAALAGFADTSGTAKVPGGLFKKKAAA